jgi:PAS domain S-box-containing protein
MTSVFWVRKLPSRMGAEVTAMNEHSDQWLCQQIVNNAAAKIIFADSEGVVRLWNDAAERMFGFSAEEMVGKSMESIIPGNLRERHWDGYNEAMKTGQTQYSRGLLAVPALRKDGTRISIEFTIALIRDPSGQLLGPAAILRDVTARWNEDRELRKRMTTLEAQLKKLNVEPAS